MTTIDLDVRPTRDTRPALHPQWTPVPLWDDLSGRLFFAALAAPSVTAALWGLSRTSLVGNPMSLPQTALTVTVSCVLIEGVLTLVDRVLTLRARRDDPLSVRRACGDSALALALALASGSLVGGTPAIGIASLLTLGLVTAGWEIAALLPNSDEDRTSPSPRLPAPRASATNQIPAAPQRTNHLDPRELLAD